jgi:hypothetical protein
LEDSYYESDRYEMMSDNPVSSEDSIKVIMKPQRIEVALMIEDQVEAML